MLSGAWRIGAVRGIDIRIHSSWIIIALLIGWSFFTQYAPGDRFGMLNAAVMATVAAGMFFASVLAHELAHSLEARHRGVHVGGITLFLFGGVTETRFDVKRPRDEFALTAVGPATSFVLAAAFGIAATYAQAAGLDQVATVAGSLGWINAALGAFNLLPGAPLDGGRILRSAVWWITGDRTKAIAVAARAGQVLGVLVAGYGLLQLFTSPAGFANGLWLAFIGWFLYGAARQELGQQRARVALEGRAVADVIEPASRTLRDDATIDQAVEELTRSPLDSLPVTTDGQITAVVRVQDASGVSDDRRGGPVTDIAISIDDLPTVEAHDDVIDVVELVRSHPAVAVRDPEGAVVAVATEQRLIRALRRATQLAPSGPARGRDRTGRRRDGHIPDGGSAR